MKQKNLIAAEKFNQSDTKIIAFYRMSKYSYRELVKLVVPNIQKIYIGMRKCVVAEESILITLR